MQVKVKYTKQLDNGALKRVSEPYLLTAMSFTDAEARIHEELGSVIRGEFHVVAIQRVEIHDIFAYEDDVWYRAKVSYESVDSDSEKARKVTNNFLVSAESVKQATERIQESLTGMLSAYEIKSVIESPIVDIFPYPDEENEGVLLTEITEQSVVIIKNNPAAGQFVWGNGMLKLMEIVEDDDSEQMEIDDSEQLFTYSDDVYDQYKDEKFLVVAYVVAGDMKEEKFSEMH